MKEKGFGLIEVLAVASIISVALVSITALMASSLHAETEERLEMTLQNKTQSLLEAARNIYQSDWQAIKTNGEYYPEVQDGHWALVPGKDTREAGTELSLTIESAYRVGSEGGIGVGDLVPTGGYEDFDTKKITARVVTPDGQQESVTYLSRWQNLDWRQDDWSGGSGQTNWSDPTRYASDDGNVDVDIPGQITLNQGVGSCSTHTWAFDNGADYVFDTGEIEVAAGGASLVASSGGQDADTMGTWHLDDSSDEFIDDSSKGNDLGIPGSNNDPTFGVAGKFGTAVAFDGNNDYGRIRDNQQSSLDGMAALTIDAWVNPSVLSGSADIVSKWSSSSAVHRSYRLYISADGSVTIDLRNGLTKAVSATTNTGAIVTGTWTHVAAVYDGSKVYLFVNGLLAMTPVNYNGGIGNGNSEFRVSGSGGSSFHGSLDEVRISDVARWTSNFPLPTGPNGIISYPTIRPDIRPATSYSPGPAHGWMNFSETANKGDGEIYYQLSQDGGSIWLYWNGSKWSSAGSNNYNTATEIDAQLAYFPTRSDQILFRAFLSSDGDNDVELDAVSIACRPFQMVVGQVNTDEQWASVTFSVTFTDPPVVIGSYLESANSLPANVRVRNVQTTGFDIRLQHPTGADLAPDLISYLVVERGIWNIGGQTLEAGYYDTSTVGRQGNWQYDSVNFKAMTSEPIVLHQVMSANDPAWITTYVSRSNSRTNPPRSNGMRIALNGAEVTISHGTETIGWVAINRNLTGSLNGVEFETIRTGDSVRGHDNGCLQTNFNNTYGATPIVFGTQLEMDGDDGGWAVTCNTTSATRAYLHIEEDQVGDAERSHQTETTGIMAFATPFEYSLSSGGFATSGQLDSSSFDTGASTTVYNYLSFMALEPAGTDLQLQLATNNDNATWSYLGPDGTSTTYYEIASGQVIPYAAHLNQRYVRYRVFLTSSPTESPRLDEVTINYSP